MRTCRFTSSHPPLRFTVHLPCRLVLRHPSYEYGIVVNERALIGRNCNLSQQMALGQANRGRREGHPVREDDVYHGPGAKAVGAVHIGNDVAVGANCVVVEDVPDHAVVVGVAGRVVSFDGAAGYVRNTDYAPLPSGRPAIGVPSSSA